MLKGKEKQEHMTEKMLNWLCSTPSWLQMSAKFRPLLFYVMSVCFGTPLALLYPQRPRLVKTDLYKQRISRFKKKNNLHVPKIARQVQSHSTLEQFLTLWQ